MSYRNIIVGTDGSETAARAVSHAAQLAADHEARLVIVTAYEPQGDELARSNEAPEEIRWMLTDRIQAEELAASGRAVATEAGVGSVAVRSSPGKPSEVLLEVAEDFGADCIVVGSRGLTGAGRFLGSVASDVAHHAPCDVLIVHTT